MSTLSSQFASANAILRRVMDVRSKQGWCELLGRLKRFFFRRFSRLLLKGFARRRLKKILERYPSRVVVVFPPIVPWNLQLFQRPHHVAKELAALGYLYFFCIPPSKFDSVTLFKEMVPGCFITPYFDLLESLPGKIVHLYSTDNSNSLGWIRRRLESGDIFLYEYVDEIHEDITGGVIPPFVLEKHRYLLRREEVISIATADKLFREVGRERRRNCALITNGVDVSHFSTERKQSNIPIELMETIRRKRPVIGYFGALAKWFDYRLVLSLAERRPDYEILLIGPDYDGSAKAVSSSHLPNIKMLGAMAYRVLPEYACWFDVAMIPFVLNEITASTSPIKLFEYMALGHPVVTTDMPECRKYSSVLIGRDVDDFIDKIDMALQLRNDAQYRKSLRIDAGANSWASKAKAINALLGSRFENR